MTRIAKREKLAAIVKMKPGYRPPTDYIDIRMKIAGDIYTIDGHEEDLKKLSKAPNVVSLEYSRPTHQLVKLP